ncbi:excisionase [Bacteroidota bacterium]|jgi:excisionase family DNA binding protein|nr:excisionase [Bacteroidota bacterium]
MFHMKESITHLQAFITELVNEAVQVALEQHQETAITELAENNLKSEILNADQAAEFLHIAKQTLYSMTSRRKIPFYKNGKKILFRKGELQEWLNSGKHEQEKNIQREALRYVQDKPLKR